MLHLRTLAAVAAAAFVFCATTGAQALEQKPIMTLEIAKKIADGCEAKAIAEGWRPINIAIFDAGANLKLFRRQENAFFGSIQVSQLKGHSSAMFPFSTRLFAELAHGKDGNPAPLPGIANIPGIATFAGGLPIMTAGGDQIGGIGVSGASSDEDEQCAQAGIDAAADLLK